MLHLLPPVLLGSLSFFLLLINTVFWCIPLYALALLKALFRTPRWQLSFAQALSAMADGWIDGAMRVIRMTQKTRWDVEVLGDLRRDSWFIVCCNHQSWVDIMVLVKAFHRRIPSPKFFAKKELLRLPLLGLALRALDFPLVERYSREFLDKHPELRGRDLETIRRSCERFRQAPAAIVIFPEGTRFTPEKHDVQQSPYRHLLRPKIGGLTATMEGLGDRIDSLLDVTIVYPEGRPSFWDFLSGRIGRVVVRVQLRAIPQEFLTGGFQGDPHSRERFQSWVAEAWREKDALIEKLHGEVK